METNAENKIAIVKPVMSLNQYQDNKSAIINLVKNAMKSDTDYGTIPGTQKKTLYQAGAEKLANFFNLAPSYELIKEVEDWEKGFFFYKYKCTLTHIATDRVVGNAERSCNSSEKKYAYTSVAEKWATEDQKKNAIRKEQRQSKGYTNTYLILKKTPEEAADQVNTIMAMAQKRALVACVRTATMATEIFDDDAPETNGGKVTKDEDPKRIALLGRLFATGADRGFTSDQVKNSIKKQNQVESTTDCTNDQIMEFIEKLITTFERVEAGEAPKKIGTEEGTVEVATPEGAVKAGLSDAPVESESEETRPTGDVATKVEEVEVEKEVSIEYPECYQCKKTRAEWPSKRPAKLPAQFCSTECQDLYYPPVKAKKTSFTLGKSKK